MLLPRVVRPASERPSQHFRIDVRPPRHLQHLVTKSPSKFVGKRPQDAPDSLRTVELSFEIIDSELLIRTRYHLDRVSYGQVSRLRGMLSSRDPAVAGSRIRPVASYLHSDGEPGATNAWAVPLLGRSLREGLDRDSATGGFARCPLVRDTLPPSAYFVFSSIYQMLSHSYSVMNDFGASSASSRRRSNQLAPGPAGQARIQAIGAPSIKSAANVRLIKHLLSTFATASCMPRAQTISS